MMVAVPGRPKGEHGGAQQSRPAGGAPDKPAARWQAWWDALGDRERIGLGVAGVLLGCALVWWLLIKPPLALLRTAPAQHDALDAQLQTMQRLALDARELRRVPRIDGSQATAAVKAATARLGAAARLSIQGDRAVMNIEGLDAEALKSWLAEVRSGARARPIEAQLTRGNKGLSGSVTLSLGGAS